MKFLKRIGVFSALLFLSAILGSFIFPPEETLPEWYSNICILVSIVISIFYGRKSGQAQKAKGKTAKNNSLTPDSISDKKIPFSQQKRNGLATDLLLDAGKANLISYPNARVDIDEIIRREKVWRESQQGHEFSERELEKVDSMEGHDFERFCASILSKNGFSDVEVTQGSGDQGVDVLAKKDGIKYAIQCKCYSSDLGNKPVQEVNSGKVIYHCHIGVVLTNRYFTSGAKQAADATGVLLWDRDKLKYLIDNTVSEE